MSYTPEIETHGITNPDESADRNLEESIRHIVGIAQEKGYSFFPINFEIVPARALYELGAYGIPGKFCHWTHGRDYFKMKSQYNYGLSKIYELVVNTNPVLAYLLNSNLPADNKMVAAHVTAHADFFKNNISFANTNRQMAETAQLHSDRIREYEYEYGEKVVEEFIDKVLAIQSNVEWSLDKGVLQKPSAAEYVKQNNDEYAKNRKKQPTATSSFDDLFTREELGIKPAAKGEKAPFPIRREEDLMWFVKTFSRRPLEEWQADIMEIIRDEYLYFRPQMGTKIMNEGWATMGHQRIMQEMEARELLEPGEDIEWKLKHSSVTASNPRQLNPYQLGFAMWQDIDRKFHGIPIGDKQKEKNIRGELVDVKTFEGDPYYDIFFLRQTLPDDVAFLRRYLTGAVIEETQFYLYGKGQNGEVITEKDPEVIRNFLISMLVNLNNPMIKVEAGGGNYHNSGELYLVHEYEDQEVDIGWAGETLKSLNYLWGNKVHLETRIKDEVTVLTHDGDKFTQGRKT